MDWKYTIVWDTDRAALESTVATLLSLGWKLQGGIAVCAGVAGVTVMRFAKALYKEPED